MPIYALPHSVTFILLPLPDKVATSDLQATYEDQDALQIVSDTLFSLLVLGALQDTRISITIVGGQERWARTTPHGHERRYHASPLSASHLRNVTGFDTVQALLTFNLSRTLSGTDGLGMNTAQEYVEEMRFLTVEEYRAEVGEHAFKVDTELVYSLYEEKDWARLKIQQ
jgi:hypothetical protein